jgi:hypothetical protein
MTEITSHLFEWLRKVIVQMACCSYREKNTNTVGSKNSKCFCILQGYWWIIIQWNNSYDWVHQSTIFLIHVEYCMKRKMICFDQKATLKSRLLWRQLNQGCRIWSCAPTRVGGNFLSLGEVFGKLLTLKYF